MLKRMILVFLLSLVFVVPVNAAPAANPFVYNVDTSVGYSITSNTATYIAPNILVNNRLSSDGDFYINPEYAENSTWKTNKWMHAVARVSIQNGVSEDLLSLETITGLTPLNNELTPVYTEDGVANYYYYYNSDLFTLTVYIEDSGDLQSYTTEDDVNHITPYKFSSDKIEEIFKKVKFTASSTDLTTDRTINFSIGDGYAYNGHLYKMSYYEFNLLAENFDEVDDYLVSYPYLANSAFAIEGYASNITTATENTFLANMLQKENTDYMNDIDTNFGENEWFGPILGGSDINSDRDNDATFESGDDGIWKWLDGPEVGQTFFIDDIDGGVTQEGFFSSWQNVTSNEPNNGDESNIWTSGQNCLTFMYSGTNSGMWDDTYCYVTYEGEVMDQDHFILVEYSGTTSGDLSAGGAIDTITINMSNIVTFKDQSNNVIAVQNIETGELASTISSPVVTGYTFSSWLNGLTAFTFTTPITTDLTLVASYTSNVVTPSTTTQTTTVTTPVLVDPLPDTGVGRNLGLGFISLGIALLIGAKKVRN